MSGCQTWAMVSTAANRRSDRSQRASELFGSKAEAALDALALVDLAWHDCYGEANPPDLVLADIWDVCKGDLAQLVAAAHLAVIDFRDLRVWADRTRASG